MLNVEKELAQLQKLGTNELQARYAEVHGETTNGRHKQWLIKRIIWRMQANAEGGLSERARRRAMELARDADIRTTIPRPHKRSTAATKSITVSSPVCCDHRLPAPGTLITRPYKSQTLSVKVLPEGFE